MDLPELEPPERLRYLRELINTPDVARLALVRAKLSRDSRRGRYTELDIGGRDYDDGHPVVHTLKESLPLINPYFDDMPVGHARIDLRLPHNGAFYLDFYYSHRRGDGNPLLRVKLPSRYRVSFDSRTEQSYEAWAAKFQKLVKKLKP